MFNAYCEILHLLPVKQLTVKGVALYQEEELACPCLRQTAKPLASEGFFPFSIRC